MANFNVSESVNLTYQRLYEYAAWYTNMRAVAGTYTLTRCTDTYGKIRYRAVINAVVTDDNFQSYFCGVPAGKAYDGSKNAGKADKFDVSFSPWELLSHASIQVSESEYDALLVEALDSLKYDIAIQMSCLASAETHWMQGHAAELARLTKAYAVCHGVKARRDWNTEQAKAGRHDGWNTTELHVTRDTVAA